MRPFQDIIEPMVIAAIWFISVFFAVSAFGSIYIALIAATAAMLLAVLWLLWLRHIEMAEEGAPMGILWVLPVTITACGLAWWAARWLGLFG